MEPDLKARELLARFAGWTPMLSEGWTRGQEQAISTALLPAYESDPALACSLLPLIAKASIQLVWASEFCNLWQALSIPLVVAPEPERVCRLIAESVKRLESVKRIQDS